MPSFALMYAYNCLLLVMTGVWLRWTASKVFEALIALMVVLTCSGVLKSPVRLRWSRRWFRLMNFLKPSTFCFLLMASIARFRYCNYRFLASDLNRRLV